MGGREYLGCVAVLAVAALLSGVGIAAVAGAVVSLFIGPIVPAVVGLNVLAGYVLRNRS